MNKSRDNKIYHFENFRLDAAHLLLYQNERQIALAPKVVETLLALVERHGEVLSKDELMEIVWADSIVEESNLSQNLYLLRKTLGAGKNGKPLIETLRRRGYRFNGDVSRIEPEQAENFLPDNAQSTAPQTSTNGHHYNVERRGNVLALADWKTNERTEPENGDSQPKIQIAAVENNPDKIQPTGNLSAIVGREKEIVKIKNLLSQDDVRLVTLAGVGGVGKTKLAQTVAQEMSRDFSDGVFFIELAAITNAEFVVSTIAQSLGVKESGKPVLENLKEYLRGRQILLVVDNFEQVVDAAPNIAELLAAANDLKILITSRVLLHLSAEQEFIVPPLAVPDEITQISIEELPNYEAIELFVERARNAKPNFALTDENATDVAEICARLDGLPLAIELAAARIKILSPRAILAKLENRLKLLIGGASDLPARQQTMRGAIEWSYDLLTEDEKHLFRRLAIFAGGFTFEAAEAVCSNYDLEIANYESSEDRRLKTADQIEVLDLITSLVDKSLLASKEQANDERRFRMLETVREYALESLEINNEAEAMRRKHAAYFLALGEEADLHLRTAQAGEWLNRLEDDHDNLRAAIRWLFENDAEMAARLVAAIRVYLINHCHLTEGRKWLERALERRSNLPAGVRFKLSNVLGYLAFSQGDYEKARKFFEADLAEAQTAGDKRQIAESLRGLGVVAHSQDNYAAARKFHDEGLAIHRASNDKFGIAATLNGLALLEGIKGNCAAAHELSEESLTIFRQLGNEGGICSCLLSLGLVAYIGGDYKAARRYYEEAVTIAQNLGYKDRIGSCLDGFAALAAERKNWNTAAQLAGAAERLREAIGYEPENSFREFCLKYVEKVRAALSEADFAKLYEQGCKLKLEEAVALCLEENKPPIIQTLKTNLPANETAARSINQKANNRNFIYIGLGFCLLALTAFFGLSKLSKTQPENLPDNSAARIEPTVKFYWSMNEVEQMAVIQQRAQYIQTLIGDAPTELNEESLRAIKVEIDDYVEEKDSLSQEPFEEGLRVIYGRASQFAPLIIRVYEERQVPPAMGLYQAMLESEYHDCIIEAGTVGLFRFSRKTAAKYGLTAKDYCDLEKQSDAAAHYMSDLSSDFSDGKSGATLVLLSYRIGEGNVREYLRQLHKRGVTERSFWAVFRHQQNLQPPLTDEGKTYVSHFFAVAIIGETPEAFELSTPPLSTLRGESK